MQRSLASFFVLLAVAGMAIAQTPSAPAQLIVISSSGGAPSGGGGGEEDTANLWIDTDGGTCTRSASLVAYSDAAACSSMSAAATAATSGDTIGMKAGTYGGQGTVGASGKTLTYVGEGPTLTVIDSQDANGSEGSPSAYNTLNFEDNTTVRSIGVTGDYPIVGFFSGTSNVTWEDFRMTGREVRTCSPGSDEPIIIQSDGADDGSNTISNITLRHGYVGAFKASNLGEGGCPPDDTFHLEPIRIGRDVNGVLIDDVYFEDCPSGSGFGGCNTAHILVTTPNTSAAKPRNITIRNSFFGRTHGAQPNIDLHGNVTECDTYLFAYNTFFGAANPVSIGAGAGCTSTSSVTIVGNLGSRAQSACTAADWTKNVWQWNLGTACGTDTRVDGDQFSVDQLGINATTKKLDGGSVAIDAAEATCATTANAEDFEGDARPNGSACDAGADES